MKCYMHAGSLNHGCEAIVRSTVKMTTQEVFLFSEHPEEDYSVGLNEICGIIRQGGSRSKYNPIFVFCKLFEILFKKSSFKHRYAYKNVINSANKGELYISIGGDNYCYGANPYLIYINKTLNNKGAKTGLWGCSIEPEVLKDDGILEDMRRYSFITARESITYNALKELGLNNTYLFPDPAFTLESMECELPSIFMNNDVIGINISPLVQKLDETGKIVLENYIQLVNYILTETNFGIVLIPHVCKPGNDDRVSLDVLSSFFKDDARVVLINKEGNMDCRKLKYIISKCRFMVTARTHASIAAYSSCVPTLVIGYSVKAKGIAKDIFGENKHFVADIHDMKDDKLLVRELKYLIQNESMIVDHLKSFMPNYILEAEDAGQLLKNNL